MMNWKEVRGLHVIKKIEDIILKWFQVDILYFDEYYNLNNDQQSFHNPLFYNSGIREKVLDHLKSIVPTLEDCPSRPTLIPCIIPHSFHMALPITIENEFKGILFACPLTNGKDIDEIKKDLDPKIFSEQELNFLKQNIQGITEKEREYLKELLELLVQEIHSFFKEILVREARIDALNNEVTNKYRYHSMIGKSLQMKQVYSLLDKISRSETTVLIQGENGTGKELVAKAIHYNSPRKNSVFIAQNCSAFNDNLLDSELFGHVKGAFTGAIKEKKGLFDAANGGTLFLDEIGDTSPSMQVKLLRVLQEGTFIPVGGTLSKKVNVRIIAATNRNLQEMMKAGEFREDLYYRINVINIKLPLLNQRKDDIVLLVDHFLEKHCSELGIPTKIMSKKCLEKITEYSWPGNVRELENEVERLVVLSGDNKTITPDLLAEHIDNTGQKKTIPGIDTQGTLKKAVESLEIAMIKEGLKRCHFNKSKLAKELGISRAGLIIKVDKYKLDKRKKSKDGFEAA